MSQDEHLDTLIAESRQTRERLASDEADLYRQKGALAFLRNTDEAMRAYLKVTELTPDDPEGWNRLGQLQLRAGKVDAAMQSIERATKLVTSK